MALDEFLIEARIIKIECAVVENYISAVGRVNHPQSAVAKSGIEFFARCAGKQTDAGTTAICLLRPDLFGYNKDKQDKKEFFQRYLFR